MYERVRWQPGSFSGPVRLHTRHAGATPLLCRPATTDAKVFWDVFYHRYHLPPKGVHPTGCIVDLGANVGYTAVDLATRYPLARIIAVEMDAENAKLCARNTSPFGPRCQVVWSAVWVTNGQVRYTGRQAWSFRVSALDGAVGSGHRSAPARTLEDIFDEFAIDTVDYLKMDI
ncbi:MAG: FkbM family methyltransferase, partial [Planctomycetota bacterium]